MQLKLDFSIEGSENRINFLNEYIQDQSFTNDNLEMMANYILWAVEAESNENFEIETKHSPWQSDRHISLEALAEQEQETGMPLAAILSDIQVRKTKTKLSREDIVKKLQGKAPSLAEPSRDADEAIPRQNDELISQWSAATWTWFSLWRQMGSFTL